jgi:hypothetical protein
MESKLTLKLDKSMIEGAKAYAEKSEKSLSRIVEDYFRNIVAEKAPTSYYSPLVEELSGVISEKDLSTADYASYLEEKYG